MKRRVKKVVQESSRRHQETACGRQAEATDLYLPKMPQFCPNPDSVFDSTWTPPPPPPWSRDRRICPPAAAGPRCSPLSHTTHSEIVPRSPPRRSPTDRTADARRAAPRTSPPRRVRLRRAACVSRRAAIGEARQFLSRGVLVVAVAGCKS